MHTTTGKVFNMSAIQSSWTALDTMTHLRPAHDEAAYERMLVLMSSLLDEVGDDEDHALSGLLELVGDIVANYEREHFAIDKAEPGESLRYLMELRGLKQSDLGAIIPQGNLSAILSGKRKISAVLAGKLGKFFGVSPALFIPG